MALTPDEVMSDAVNRWLGEDHRSIVDIATEGKLSLEEMSNLFAVAKLYRVRVSKLHAAVMHTVNEMKKEHDRAMGVR